jgi:hypothetical protein
MVVRGELKLRRRRVLRAGRQPLPIDHRTDERSAPKENPPFRAETVESTQGFQRFGMSKNHSWQRYSYQGAAFNDIGIWPGFRYLFNMLNRCAIPAGVIRHSQFHCPVETAPKEPGGVLNFSYRQTWFQAHRLVVILLLLN